MIVGGTPPIVTFERRRRPRIAGLVRSANEYQRQ
jgi:hypothetical protein